MKLKIGKRTGLKYFNANDIRSWSPCYDPRRYFTDDQRLNAIKILEDSRISIPDRLWCILRIELVSEKLMRLFAVWCARQVQHLMEDKRSINALDVAERFANGLAAKGELAAARDAARAAARDAAWDAARAAQVTKLIEMVKAEGLERVK